MWLWILATLAAYYVKGLCGFANTLVFTTILGFGEANVAITPVELLLSFPGNLILAWKNRKSLKRQVYLPLALLVLAGSIPGALLLKNANVRLIKLLFGVVVVLLALEMLLRERNRIPRKTNRLTLGAIGLLSGVLCGLFGVGALLAAYIGRVTENSDEFKANISAVFIADNVFRIVLYSALGVITPSGIRQAALLLPVMLLGLWAGIRSAGRLPDKTVRRLVIALLIVSGLALIVMNL